MKTAVIFDLDGTLLDTLDDLFDSVNFILARHSLPLRTREEVRCFVGNGIPKLIERALPSPDHPLYKTCLEEFKEYYGAHSRIRTAPYAGVLPALERLSHLRVPVAIVTNKTESAAKQLCFDLFGELVPVVVGDREGMNKKPSPEPVFEAMRQLGCDHAVYVGDSDVDLMTARNAKLPCVSVTWGFRDRALLESLGADIFADTPSEMLDIVLSMLGGM